jgi:hypothetical protein
MTNYAVFLPSSFSLYPQMKSTLHPQKFGCTPKNEGKRVHVLPDEKTCGHTLSHIPLYYTMFNSLKIFSVQTTGSTGTKLRHNGPWMVPFHNCVHQRRPVSKMAAITKNRNFFKWPKLLYFKPESAQQMVSDKKIFMGISQRVLC